MNHSTGGSRSRPQAAWSGRAGIGRWAVAPPAGARSATPARRRQLTAKADTATSSRPASASRAPAQNTPTPVGRPSKGVASNPTDSRSVAAVAAVAGRSGGTS